MDVPELKAISVKRIFELECKHMVEFKKGEIGYQEKMEGKKDFPWADCVECICAFIPFKVPYGGNSEGYIFRDVCFANWHDYMNEVAFNRYGEKSVSFSDTFGHNVTKKEWAIKKLQELKGYVPKEVFVSAIDIVIEELNKKNYNR